MSIYKKLLEVQKKIKGLGKNEKSGSGSYGYSYVSGSKVLEAIKPIMNEQGLLLKQEVIRVENERIDYKTRNGEKSEMLYKVWQKFTWIDVETGEKDINEFYSTGQNDWEKGLGSALTYAERYFLLKYFHIATDEDDIDNSNRKKTEIVKEFNNNPVKQSDKDKYIKAICDIIGENMEKLDKLTAHYKVNSLIEMTEAQLKECSARLIRR